MFHAFLLKQLEHVKLIHRLTILILTLTLSVVTGPLQHIINYMPNAFCILDRQRRFYLPQRRQRTNRTGNTGTNRFTQSVGTLSDSKNAKILLFFRHYFTKSP